MVILGKTVGGRFPPLYPKLNQHLKTACCIYLHYLCVILNFVWWSESFKCDKYAKKKIKTGRGQKRFQGTVGCFKYSYVHVYAPFQAYFFNFSGVTYFRCGRSYNNNGYIHIFNCLIKIISGQLSRLRWIVVPSVPTQFYARLFSPWNKLFNKH